MNTSFWYLPASAIARMQEMACAKSVRSSMSATGEKYADGMLAAFSFST